MRKIRINKGNLENLAMLILLILVYSYAISRYGSSVTPDSTAYVEGGISMWKEGKFVIMHEEPYYYFPPLYPILIGLIYGITTIPADIVAELLNFSAIAITLLLFLNRFASSSIERFCMGIGFVFFYPIFLVTTSIFAEPLFILLVFLFLLFVERYTKELTLYYLLLLSVLASLAMLQRYVGLVLIPFTGFIILIYNNRNWKKIMLHSIIVGFSCLPLSIWMLRNHLLVGTLTGSRISSAISLIEHLDQDIILPLSYLLIPIINFPFRSAFAIIGIFILFIIPAFRKNIIHHLVYYLFALFYILSIWILIKYLTFLAVPARIFAPIAPFLLLLVRDSLVSVWSISTNKIHKSVVFLTLFLWLGLQVRIVGQHVEAAHQYGAGGERVKHIKENELGKWLSQHAKKLGGTWRSNNPTFLYWLMPREMRNDLYYTGSAQTMIERYKQNPTGYLVLSNDDSLIYRQIVESQIQLDSCFESIEGGIYRTKLKSK